MADKKEAQTVKLTYGDDVVVEVPADQEATYLDQAGFTKPDTGRKSSTKS